VLGSYVLDTVIYALYIRYILNIASQLSLHLNTFLFVSLSREFHREGVVH